MNAVQARSGCDVLWCESPHRSKRQHPYHFTVIQRSAYGGTVLTASLGWQEGTERGPYVTVEASDEEDEQQRRLCILPIGIAEALGRLVTRDPELYGPGGRFLTESIDMGSAILE